MGYFVDSKSVAAQDLSAYALKTDIPSTAGLATTTALNAVAAAIPSTSGLATTSALAAVAASIPAVPSLSTAAPAAVGVMSTAGSTGQASDAGHTHATSVQGARLAVSGSAGLVTWTFPTSYPAGTVPVCDATVEVVSGTTRAYTVDVYGTPTNTSVTYIVFGPPTVTISALGTAVNVTFPVATAGTIIHAIARKPTQ